ncbi:MAG: hypothetical protein AAF436_08035 [Myxococcota bacterium]
MGRHSLLFSLGLFLTPLAACQPNIGDSCGSSRDCSATGERQCDLTQPGGYCTVRGCDADTCPDNAICVEWRFNPTRTAETWCMKACGGDGGCRTGAGYLCAPPNRINLDGDLIPEDCDSIPLDQQLARVIDLDSARSLSSVCAAVGVTDSCVLPDDPTVEEFEGDAF